MVGQGNNSIFQQWLAAYGNHLEQVTGTADSTGRIDINGEDGSTGTNDIPPAVDLPCSSGAAAGE